MKTILPLIIVYFVSTSITSQNKKELVSKAVPTAKTFIRSYQENFGKSFINYTTSANANYLFNQD